MSRSFILFTIGSLWVL